MERDLIVQRAKIVINDLGIVNRIDVLKEYTNVVKLEPYSENYLKRYILSLAENQSEMNYKFIKKVLKQIKLLLL